MATKSPNTTDEQPTATGRPRLRAAEALATCIASIRYDPRVARPRPRDA